MSILLAASLFMVEGFDGRIVFINPEQVVSVAPPKENDALFARGVRCVISLSDRKFVTTRESCDVLRARVSGTTGYRL